MKGRSLGITLIRLFRSGKLDQSTYKPLLLNILRHNIACRCIQSFSHKLWELARMSAIRANHSALQGRLIHNIFKSLFKIRSLRLIECINIKGIHRLFVFLDIIKDIESNSKACSSIGTNEISTYQKQSQSYWNDEWYNKLIDVLVIVSTTGIITTEGNVLRTISTENETSSPRTICSM